MWAWLAKFHKPKFLVVEIEKPRPLPVATTEDQIQAVRQLEHSPGFQVLLQKFRLQRAVLEAHLKKSNHDSLRKVIRLQEGIFWMSWLEDQLTRAIGWKKPTPELPLEDLQKEFERVHFALFGEAPKP